VARETFCDRIVRAYPTFRGLTTMRSDDNKVTSENVRKNPPVEFLARRRFVLGEASGSELALARRLAHGLTECRHACFALYRI